MFNFYSIFIFVLIITLWFVCSVTLIQVPDLYYNFSDLYTRLWLNEFFLNMYYFYWTSFWYLVVIVAITKLTFVLVYVRYVTPNLLALTACLLVYTTTMYEYYDHNFIHMDFLKTEYQINSLLTNSINKYHPFIFYFTLTWVYVVNNSTNNFMYCRLFFFISKKQFLIKNLNFFLPMIYLTLGLGSWWALQEGSWGGWWNWDSSEVFGLLVMSFYLHFMHKKLWSINSCGLKVWGNTFVLKLILIYILIQLNFSLVSHNFGTKISQFINSDQLFYIFLILVIVKIFLTVRQSLTKVYNYLNATFLKNLPIKILIFVCLCVIIVLLSFTELLNNFVWLTLKVDIINIINLTTYYTPLTLLIVYLSITRINFILVVVFSYLTWSLCDLYLLCTSTIVLTKIYNLHSIIYMFILVTYSYINQSLIDWTYLSSNIHSFMSKNVIDLYTSFIKLNTSYIEVVSTNLVSNQTVFLGWNFIQWSTNQQVHTFKHDLLTNLTFQSLYTSLFEYVHNICVIDYSSQVLALLILIWFVFLRDVRKNKTIMLF